MAVRFEASYLVSDQESRRTEQLRFKDIGPSPCRDEFDVDSGSLVVRRVEMETEAGRMGPNGHPVQSRMLV